MKQTLLTDEDLTAAVELLASHGGNQTAAAGAAGLARASFQNRLRRAAERGLSGYGPVMAGYVAKTVSGKTADGTWVKQVKAPGAVFVPPPGFEAGRITVNTDPEGRETQRWQRYETGKPDPLALIEAIKVAFVDYEGTANPVKAPIFARSDLLTLTPCNDWHIGLFSWGKDTGVDWDLKIAERVIGETIDDVVSRSPSSGTAIVLGGGDALHADNSENKTARSGNVLDVDGRYPKVLQVASRLHVRTIDRHLEKHEKVIVRMLPGNHDEHSAVALAYFLLAWYRNEPRVTVDVDPSLFFWHRFGKVMLGATHGHTVKLDKMPGIMAHRRAEDWGLTKHRFVHGFHIHHSSKFATEGDGVISESHQAPIPPDSWHFGAGYNSGRSISSISYHRERGEYSRVRSVVQDGAAANDNELSSTLARAS
jgi:hypothetical protein